jgi:NAD(P)-dependent dehydrogenase (short-subunit alcohol dehydrogenase family)
MTSTSRIVLITGKARPLVASFLFSFTFIINFVLGANSGVGYETAKVLTAASANYHVIIGARSTRKGAEAVQTLQSDPNTKGSLSTVQIDVNDKSSISAAAKQVEKEFGRVDALINNAGICVLSEDLEYELESQFKTNVIGAVLTTRAFLPLLLKSSSAYLIYITSSLGSLTEAATPGSPFAAWKGIGYRVSKQAMNMVMVEDHKEFAPQGIKVFSVCPGLVESNLRGTRPEQVTAGGRARPAADSGKLLLSVLEGKRDADVGKYLHYDGVRPW